MKRTITPNDAPVLDALLALLIEEEAAANASGFKLSDVVDITDLPTYGGRPLDDTQEVWSWDATRVLVGADRFEIVTRDEWDETVATSASEERSGRMGRPPKPLSEHRKSVSVSLSPKTLEALNAAPGRNRSAKIEAIVTKALAERTPHQS